MSGRTWALVCAPDDPAAANALSVPAPRLVPWADVLDGTASFGAGELVHAERLIPAVPVRYGGSRARYDRLAAALATLHDQLAAAGATGTADAAATLLALDRKLCAEQLAAAGIPVPAVGGEYLRQRFAEPGDAITEGRGSIRTTMALVRTRSGYELHHTLNQKSYFDASGERPGEADLVRTILTRDDEIFAVKDLPTAYLLDEQHRFRFAVVDGRVTHAAGRLAESHAAREYYGGRRREIDAYHGRFGVAAWQRLIDIAEQAATAFPSLRSIGVDIAASQIKGPDLVYDIDPFGAHLPAALGIPGSAGEGLEVRATALRAWMT